LVQVAVEEAKHELGSWEVKDTRKWGRKEV
jgi:hypothetical protein